MAGYYTHSFKSGLSHTHTHTHTHTIVLFQNDFVMFLKEVSYAKLHLFDQKYSKTAIRNIIII